MWLWLCVSLVDDVLAHMLGQDLVEDVVDGEREAGLVLQQLLHQQRVQIVGVHHVVPAAQRRVSIIPRQRPFLFPQMAVSPKLWDPHFALWSTLESRAVYKGSRSFHIK